MTPWYAALLVLGPVAFALAFWKGGRVERVAAMVLSANYLLTLAIDGSWAYRGAVVVAGLDGASALIFLGLALRNRRWWLLAATAGLLLATLTWVIGLVDPTVGFYAAASAAIGEWAFVYLTLIAGVWERWLAGERPAAPSTIWRRRKVP